MASFNRWPLTLAIMEAMERSISELDAFSVGISLSLTVARNFCNVARRSNMLFEDSGSYGHRCTTGIARLGRRTKQEC